MKSFFSFSFLLVVLIAVWLFGFLNFVGDLSAMQEPDTSQKTDAIVVLTGGSERVTKGVDLLQSGAGQKLFISGVHKNLSLDKVLAGSDVPSDLRTCCIVLGHQAGSTIGNAEETREWMVLENFRSLRLVTANYHMKRSLLLFHAAMPDIEIVPHPVTPDRVKLDKWWQHPGTIELLATEYTKYILANFEVWVGQQ